MNNMKFYTYFVCFSSIDSTERVSRCYTAVYQEKRGELSSFAEAIEGLSAVPIAMRNSFHLYIYIFA